MPKKNRQETTILFVILTSNRPEALQQCLTALAQEFDEQCACVVVDNSDEDSKIDVKRICKSYPWAKLHWMPSSPYILSTGRNTGSRMFDSDIIAFLDDDSYVKPGWVASCRSGFEDRNVGAVGGPIDDPESAGLDPKRTTNIGSISKFGEVLDNFDCIPDKPVEIEHMRGCNWAVRRSVFEGCNGFDETLTGYCFEELDLSLKIRTTGSLIKFVPNMSICHDMKPRIGGEKKTAERAFETTRNLSRIYRRYPKSIGCSYFLFWFRYKTQFFALLKNPTRDQVKMLISTWTGKIVGLLSK